jgi:hypothetical protein
MTRAGDIDFGRVSATVHFPRTVDLEQFRMQGAPIELERQLGNFRSHEQHDACSLVLSKKSRKVVAEGHYRIAVAMSQSHFSALSGDWQNVA